MFYVGLWLTMFIGWICLLVWGMTMESRDRRRAAMPRATEPRITVVQEEFANGHSLTAA
jgi:hypothetical protein